ncbi:nitrate/nitrite sensor protein NarQ [Salmonella enterica subsp. enterica]|uniref:Nitrate/nitrite sensor protein NarQ n=1 Tax=Salmonella enterica I TaxID=59201 RepID=A0A379W6D8_SALET|nr:nitrate/nitrite sensor protein NarQ [Salmonella enterica subsp. enterica]
MTVKRPVSASLAKAFFYIVLLSILSTGSALLTLTSSLRDAEAINIAGSLRMQSYRLGYDLQSRSPQINAHRHFSSTRSTRRYCKISTPGMCRRR